MGVRKDEKGAWVYTNDHERVEVKVVPQPRDDWLTEILAPPSCLLVPKAAGMILGVGGMIQAERRYPENEAFDISIASYFAELPTCKNMEDVAYWATKFEINYALFMRQKALRGNA